jgi:hypothetical protein
MAGLVALAAFSAADTSRSLGCHWPRNGKRATNIPLNLPGTPCQRRFTDLQQAQRACEMQDHCTGVTQDGGVMCGAERRVYALRTGAPSPIESRGATSWICRPRLDAHRKAELQRRQQQCSRTVLEPEHGNAATFGVLTVAVNHQPAWQVEMVRANRAHYTSLHGYVNAFEVYTLSDVKNDEQLKQTLKAVVNPNDAAFGRVAALYLKVKLMRDWLAKVDWLLWTDLDVYILDLQRPLTSFTGILQTHGYDIRVPGETFTHLDPRYQFSNFVYLVRASSAGNYFVSAHLDNITALFEDCRGDISLVDQRSQRAALAAVAYRAAGLPNPCARGMASMSRCAEYHLCMDGALMQLMHGQPLKSVHSPHPIFFEDVNACGEAESGLGLQLKQSAFQWHESNSDDLTKWLPAVQRAVRRAFAVHWNMANPFDYDNYIDYYFRWRNETHPSLYVRPEGCLPNDGWTLACCGYVGAGRKACAEYGRRFSRSAARHTKRQPAAKGR